MSGSLLTTKFYIPPIRASLVRRPRLAQLLSQGLTRPLTLVSAPGGSGKTTLVSAWCSAHAERALPIAWLALDDDDNDPVRWLRYFIGALETVLPKVGQAALALLDAAEPAPPKQVMTS